MNPAEEGQKGKTEGQEEEEENDAQQKGYEEEEMKEDEGTEELRESQVDPGNAAKKSQA